MCINYLIEVCDCMSPSSLFFCFFCSFYGINYYQTQRNVSENTKKGTVKDRNIFFSKQDLNPFSQYMETEVTTIDTASVTHSRNFSPPSSPSGSLPNSPDFSPSRSSASHSSQSSSPSGSLPNSPNLSPSQSDDDSEHSNHCNPSSPFLPASSSQSTSNAINTPGDKSMGKLVDKKKSEKESSFSPSSLSGEWEEHRKELKATPHSQNGQNHENQQDLMDQQDVDSMNGTEYTECSNHNVRSTAKTVVRRIIHSFREYAAMPTMRDRFHLFVSISLFFISFI